jgi:hypothetical protein
LFLFCHRGLGRTVIDVLRVNSAKTPSLRAFLALRQALVRDSHVKQMLLVSTTTNGFGEPVLVVPWKEIVPNLFKFFYFFSPEIVLQP